ncbi:IDEAL domain-containing protein [Neobacillus dielmonensis]|uniref:IDEAL domain-containing protein n=1 Tax=Neobacillus dielmonensis TaxID=1347369 RepID=UPI0005A99E09|nr:IDEAL domain-containing protein [Neobacillus dielmonensis]
MKKLRCRQCGNHEFYAVDVGVNLCKCGLYLRKPSDYQKDEPIIRRKHIYSEQRSQAEVITKVSLLKREIDLCLDERDHERFHKLTNELKICQHFLKSKAIDPQISFMQNKYPV